MTLPFLSDCILKTQRCDTKCTNCFLQRPLLCGCRHLQLISCVLINEQISEILKTKKLDDKLDISKYSRLESQTFVQTRYVMWTFVCYSLCICGYSWVWSMEVFHERASERFTDVHVPTCFFVIIYRGLRIYKLPATFSKTWSLTAMNYSVSRCLCQSVIALCFIFHF